MQSFRGQQWGHWNGISAQMETEDQTHQHQVSPLSRVCQRRPHQGGVNLHRMSTSGHLHQAVKWDTSHKTQVNHHGGKPTTTKQEGLFKYGPNEDGKSADRYGWWEDQAQAKRDLRQNRGIKLNKPAQHGKSGNPDQKGPPWRSVCQPEWEPGKGPQMKTTSSRASNGPYRQLRVPTYT